MLGGINIPTIVTSSAANRDWMRNPRNSEAVPLRRVTAGDYDVMAYYVLIILER